MPPELSSVLSLPSTAELLVQGGDHRIEIQPGSQINKYGCQPFPAADRIAFGSSTATQISAQAFEAADHLRNRIAAALTQQSAVTIYKEELGRLRSELLEACGLSAAPAPDLIFAASGTDAHLLASHLIAAPARRAQRPMRVIMVNPEESGSGVSAALSGRSFSAYNALGVTTSIDVDVREMAHEIMHVSIRHPDGVPRTAAAIDADVDFLSKSALQVGFDVLVVLIDVSKTGCIAPTPQFAQQLQQRWPGRVHVLVDACQFRIEMATLRAYLQQEFMVAITGSKFIGGPSFSAALFIPQSIAALMRHSGVPPQLNRYSAQEEWPEKWQTGTTLPSCANLGLLLRWEAALYEMKALRAIPGSRIRQFLQEFGAAVQQRLQSDPHFEYLGSPMLPSRFSALEPDWDDVASIHTFTLHRQSQQRQSMNNTEVTNLYQRLQKTRHSDGYIYSVGQPVICGNRKGIDISALRICVSAGLIVQACNDQTADASEALIARAMACLDAIAALIDEDSATDKEADKAAGYCKAS